MRIPDINLEKYLKKLIGRRDIEDALGRLDRLTQEEARMATAQVLKVTHRVEAGVKGVDDKVTDVDSKVNLVIEGTFSTLATPTCNRKPTRPDGKVVKQTTTETKALLQQTANNIDEDRCS